jgi:ribosomal protein L32
MFYSILSGMGMATKKGRAEYAATETGFQVQEAVTDAQLLQHDVDRLFMIAESLWMFLKKQHGYTDEDLVKAINAVDLRNAGADKDAQEKCPNCGRMVSAHRRLCLYCGKPVPRSLFERDRG